MIEFMLEDSDKGAAADLLALATLHHQESSLSSHIHALGLGIIIP